MVFSAAAGPTVNQKCSGVVSLIGNAACARLAVMAMVKADPMYLGALGEILELSFIFFNI
jgi:aquaporin NIP